MLKFAIAVAAIALPDCINPSLIGGELFVATERHPARHTAAFTLAAGTVTFVFGLALALGLGDLILTCAGTARQARGPGVVGIELLRARVVRAHGWRDGLSCARGRPALLRSATLGLAPGPAT